MDLGFAVESGVSLRSFLRKMRETPNSLYLTRGQGSTPVKILSTSIHGVRIKDPEGMVSMVYFYVAHKGSLRSERFWRGRPLDA